MWQFGDERSVWYRNQTKYIDLRYRLTPLRLLHGLRRCGERQFVHRGRRHGLPGGPGRSRDRRHVPVRPRAARASRLRTDARRSPDPAGRNVAAAPRGRMVVRLLHGRGVPWRGSTSPRACGLTELPVYARGGSIVPMGAVEESVMAGPDRELEIRIYTGTDARFTLYDDAGDGYGYEQGQIRPLHLGWSGGGRLAAHLRTRRLLPRHGAGADAPNPGLPPRDRTRGTDRPLYGRTPRMQIPINRKPMKHIRIIPLPDAVSDRRFGRGTGQIHGQRRLAFHQRIALQRLPARGRRLGMGGGEHPPHVERRGRRRRRSGILPRPGMVPQADRPPGRRRLEAGVSLFRGGQSGGAALRQRPLRRKAHGRLHALRLRHHEIHRPGRRKPLRRRGGQRPRPRHPAPVGRLHLLRRHLPRREPADPTDKVHVAPTDFGSPGVYLSTPEVTAERAAVEVRTLVANDGTEPVRVRIEHRIVGPDGREAARAEDMAEIAAGSVAEQLRRGITIASPRLWDIDEPNLYRVLTRIVTEDGRVLDEGFQPAGPAVVLVRSRQGLLAQRPPAQTHRHVPPPGLPGPRMGADRRNARTRRAPHQRDGRQLPARVALPARPPW